jgi:hypothetical protein
LAIGICIGAAIDVRSTGAVHISGIVDVDVAIDVHVRVIASTPAASVSPVAIVRNDGARGHSQSESDGSRRDGVIRSRWVIVAWIRDWITRVNDCGIILRNIDHVRLRGLNLDNLIRYIDRHLFDDVRDDRIGHRHNLLLSRFKRTAPLSLGPHPLDCIRYPFRLIDEGVAQVAGPLNIVVHLINDIGKLGNRFDIVVPRLRIEFCDIIRVFDEPGRLYDLQRIRRSRQHRRKQRIGV